MKWHKLLAYYHLVCKEASSSKDSKEANAVLHSRTSLRSKSYLNLSIHVGRKANPLTKNVKNEFSRKSLI